MALIIAVSVVSTSNCFDSAVLKKASGDASAAKSSTDAGDGFCSWRSSASVTAGVRFPCRIHRIGAAHGSAGGNRSQTTLPTGAGGVRCVDGAIGGAELFEALFAGGA